MPRGLASAFQRAQGHRTRWFVALGLMGATASVLPACANEDDEGPSLRIEISDGGRAGAAAGSAGTEPGEGGAGEDSGGGAGSGGGGAAGAGGAGSSGAGGAGGSFVGPGGTAGGAGAAGAAGAEAGGKGGGAGSGGTSAGGAGGSGGKGGAAGATAGTGGKGGGANTGGSAGATPTGNCPEGMAFVDLQQEATIPFCIDRWEAQVEVMDDTGAYGLHSPYETLDALTAAGTPTRAITHEAVVPQGYISGKQAEAACKGAGKRLCTYDEHLDACGGPTQTIWPYGDTRVPGECNEGRSTHPVIEMFGPNATFNNTELNDPGLNQLPDSLAETGAYTGCVSTFGAYDLAGNLHEWIGDPAGTFVGGFYVDAVKNYPGCLYKTTAHDFSYHDYSTGFRCCLDAPTQ